MQFKQVLSLAAAPGTTSPVSEEQLKMLQLQAQHSLQQQQAASATSTSQQQQQQQQQQARTGSSSPAAAVTPTKWVQWANSEFKFVSCE